MRFYICPLKHFIYCCLLLTTGLLSACGGEENSSPSAQSLTQSAPRSPGPGGAGITAPLIGPDGQITVIAPPATGENMAGRIFWVKDNNIWQGGAGTPGAAPLSVQELGGKPLTAVAPLALAKSPALSPDGTRLAYAYSPEPESSGGTIIIGQDIYLIDLKSGTSSMLIKRDDPQTFLDNPAWSADGKHLYFDTRAARLDKTGSIVGETISINRFDLATGQREQLIEDAREPAPLVGGTQLVFVSVTASDGSYSSNLHILDLTTRQAKALLTHDQGFGGVYLPRPSPHGRLIVFSASGGPTGSNTTPVVTTSNPPLMPTPPTSSPAGQGQSQANHRAGRTNFPLSLGLTGWLPPLALIPSSAEPRAVPAGSQLHGLPFDLWLIKPDGTGLKRLTTLYEDQPMPSWSADSQQVAFLAGQGLYLIGADGQKLIKKSNRGGHAGFVWRSP